MNLEALATYFAYQTIFPGFLIPYRHFDTNVFHLSAYTEVFALGPLFHARTLKIVVRWTNFGPPDQNWSTDVIGTLVLVHFLIGYERL